MDNAADVLRDHGIHEDDEDETDREKEINDEFNADNIPELQVNHPNLVVEANSSNVMSSKIFSLLRSLNKLQSKVSTKSGNGV